LTLSEDGTYTGTYYTLGFSGTSNGANRIFGARDGSDGIYIASATGTPIHFRAGGGTTNNLIIASTGAATFSSGIGIGGATATTGGIQFPATAVAIADANNLDDYEEGTWTPVLTCDNSPSGVTYSGRAGKYTKIGRVVHIEFVIGLTSKGTGTGDSFISGLPFVVANDMAAGEPAYVGITLSQGLSTSVYLLSGFANNSSTNLQLRKTTAASTTFPGSYLNTTDISDSLYIQGSITYHV
jgi:hypothetical protein